MLFSRTGLRMASLFSLLATALNAAALNPFVAFNDYSPGLLTHPNATGYAPGQSGKLKDITTGKAVSVSVKVTGTSVAATGVQGAPTYGSPASVIFDGFVDFGGQDTPALEMNDVTDSLVYTFTGLDSNAEYNFQGTAVRGHFSYTNRWTFFELTGAQSFAIHPTLGVLTSLQVPALTNSQVAINTGDNNNGALAWWDHIRPGTNGSFSVISRKYTKSVPGGSSDGSTSYGMIACRLEQAPEYTGRITLPDRVPNPESVTVAGISNVFVVLMENHDWSSIQGSEYCPYINKTLLPQSSYATRYYSPPGIHPSEPNYLWIVAGTNFNIRNDDLPSANRQSSTNTLFHQLDQAGISWKAYQEDIPGNNIPDKAVGKYAPRHNPGIFFDSLRTNLNYATNHYRPFTELARDLTNNTAPRFSFISPNVTNDMHDLTPGSPSTRKQGDDWLAREMPKILNSAAFSNGGALFLLWDEGSADGDGPMGMIVLSPRAKGGGYNNRKFYTHSSLLRTLQDIYGLQPYLADAQYATSLNDLFLGIELTLPVMTAEGLKFTVRNMIPSQSYLLQASLTLAPEEWVTVSRLSAVEAPLDFIDPDSSNGSARYYRVIQEP